MSGFCRAALSYITGQPEDTFAKMRMQELAEKLLPLLEAKPWLLVLDGLERVLVQYHRFDAPQLRDEEAEPGADTSDARNLLAAIRPEDDDLLRLLAAAGRSKLVVTSRLMPAALLNSSRMPLPGVAREELKGMTEEEAEQLLRAQSITGSGPAIRCYLRDNCGCHPLVTGVLAGLINDYMPNKGNFDRWADAPDGGGALNLGALDLIK